MRLTEAELPFHVNAALENGVSREEMIELVAQRARRVPHVLPSI
ncbi:MAG: carboxymuconolactone decarboxylase family protein [Candidatus Eremiobacteraeota bacterium]|nr:carboxymuconolactone decarboxylase family protein [Candidatus Eremiobacteraeota bacterium]